MWALEVRPGGLLQLDPSTLTPLPPPIRLSSGRTLGLAAGDGHLWVTATDAGQILRIDPPSASPSPAESSGSPTTLTAASFASTRVRCGRSVIPSRSAESRPGSG